MGDESPSPRPPHSIAATTCHTILVNEGAHISCQLSVVSGLKTVTEAGVAKEIGEFEPPANIETYKENHAQLVGL